jgi:hypothetical protein
MNCRKLYTFHIDYGLVSKRGNERYGQITTLKKKCLDDCFSLWLADAST